jgi:hypothetical protein
VEGGREKEEAVIYLGEGGRWEGREGEEREGGREQCFIRRPPTPFTISRSGDHFCPSATTKYSLDTKAYISEVDCGINRLFFLPVNIASNQ